MLHWLAFVATGPAHRAANSHKCTSSRPLCLPCSMPQVQRIFRRHLLPFTKNSKRHRRTTSLSAVVMDYTDYLDVAKEAANLAGSILLEAWDKPRLVKHKGTVDLVTETDQKCETTIISTIKRKYPEHAFIGEETSAEQGSVDSLTDAPTWIIDPLDGTTNFVHKFPFVCVCIGLAIDKKMVLGVVHNPILQETYTATLGGGAFRNGEAIQVSGATELRNALLATEIGTLRDNESVAAIFERVCAVVEPSRSIRQCGSCAMNMVGVASGRLDAMFEIGFGGVWDCAAGKMFVGAIIVTEAGGVVIDPTGVPLDLMCRRVLAGTPQIAAQMAAILKERKCGSKEPAPPS